MILTFAFLQPIRVPGVGKLSASAKNAFNSFVGRVFANSRQKNVVFSRITKIATKRQFLPSFTQFLPSFTQFYLVFTQFYLVFTRQGLKFSSESKLFVMRRLRNSCHPARELPLIIFDNLPGIDVVAAGVVGANRQVLDMFLLLNFQRSGILIF